MARVSAASPRTAPATLCDLHTTAAHQEFARGRVSAASKRYLSLIHRLPCVVCLNAYGKQRNAEEAHHLESVRGEHSDFATVPLCKQCHAELHDSRRRAFYLAHKLDDVKMLAWTAEQIEKLLWTTGQRIAA